MPISNLPPELLYPIFSYLKPNSRSLLRCGLVCREWRDASRVIAFHTLYVKFKSHHSYHWTRFLDITTGQNGIRATFAGLVRVIDFTLLEDYNGDLNRAFPPWIANTAEFHVRLEQSGGDLSRHPVFLGPFKITRLSLYFITCRNGLLLAQFLNSLPHLQTLAFIESNYSHRGDEDEDVIPTLPLLSLPQMNVLYHLLDDGLDWLDHFQEIRMQKLSIQIGIGKEPLWSSVYTLLDRIVYTLVELDFAYCTDFTELSSIFYEQAFPSLRCLTVTILMKTETRGDHTYCVDDSEESFAAFLSVVQSPSLHTLGIRIWNGLLSLNPDRLEGVNPNWSILDGRLGDPTIIPSLKTLRFILSSFQFPRELSYRGPRRKVDRDTLLAVAKGIGVMQDNLPLATINRGLSVDIDFRRRSDISYQLAWDGEP